ncbi:uncharacterized protein [Watersipora subatra]|uniref:uncharacterized protein isoform X2 n=1 Tax=Watersipora subatra TaxID=2589382 RepID=UPI00355B6F95
MDITAQSILFINWLLIKKTWPPWLFTLSQDMQRDQKPEPKLLPQRARFSSSPSHNASRFCKRPKDRAVSEGDSPYHMINGSSCHRIELPCQVSVTSLNANIGLPMDRLSNKLFNSTERSHTSLGVISPRRSQNGSSCFRCRGRTPRQYVIHPDWVSESLSIGKAQLTDRGGEDFIDYTKRSQSCPPPIRNVITWDNNYTESNKKVKGTKGFE